MTSICTCDLRLVDNRSACVIQVRCCERAHSTEDCCVTILRDATLSKPTTISTDLYEPSSSELVHFHQSLRTCVSFTQFRGLRRNTRVDDTLLAPSPTKNGKLHELHELLSTASDSSISLHIRILAGSLLRIASDVRAIGLLVVAEAVFLKCYSGLFYYTSVSYHSPSISYSELVQPWPLAARWSRSCERHSQKPRRGNGVAASQSPCRLRRVESEGRMAPDQLLIRHL